MTTLHVVSHTHWDREWYLTFQEFRYRMVQMIDDLLDLLDRDPEFRHFTLDGQTIVLDDYLEIERVRFGEQLRVTRDVAPEAMDAPVPSLILQPLVENAVRHGRGSDGRIDLTILVQPRGEGIEISVADKGAGMPSGFEIGVGSGHGLHNVHERLTKTYGDACELEIANNEPQGTIVTLRIPRGEKV